MFNGMRVELNGSGSGIPSRFKVIGTGTGIRMGITRNGRVLVQRQVQEDKWISYVMPFEIVYALQTVEACDFLADCRVAGQVAAPKTVDRERANKALVDGDYETIKALAKRLADQGHSESEAFLLAKQIIKGS